MAQDNQVSASLTAEQIKAMKNNVVSIKNQLNFLVNLTPQERQSYPKMADILKPFSFSVFGWFFFPLPALKNSTIAQAMIEFFALLKEKPILPKFRKAN